MRSFLSLITGCIVVLAILIACVDPLDSTQRGKVDVIVVDGTITNLAETIVIQLNRSKADSITGRFGTLPLAKASVEVVIDSSQVIVCFETYPGTYQLPADFKGQIGHAYQLRFTLASGSHYVSTQQIMQPVASINKVTAQFNPKAISPPFSDNFYTAGHDLFIDFNDPADQLNYYRWEWIDYEPQEWCRSCYEGFYATNILEPLAQISYPYFYSLTQQPYEDCFYPPSGSLPRRLLSDRHADYRCRTSCWEIIHDHTINVFADQFSNGGLITRQSVAHIPFYQNDPCLIDVRQESLSQDAYRYYRQLQQQTQNTGGLGDTPPTALGGNVHNVSDLRENVVGYFTASAVAVNHYYLDRKDASGTASPGLFYGLNARLPTPEMSVNFVLNRSQDRTAICGPIDQRTPFKPVGWPN